MTPKYRLHYFNAMAAAEPIRLIFAYAKVDYEDVRVPSEDWPRLKASMPWRQLPVLEIDGEYLAQSSSIGRYLGRKFGLVGETELEGAKCDEFTDAIGDVRDEVRKYLSEKEENHKEDLKTKLEEETLPMYFQKFTVILKKNGSGYLVGKTLTYADIYVAFNVDHFSRLFTFSAIEKSSEMMKHMKFVMGHPGIKEWIATRPQTQF